MLASVLLRISFCTGATNYKGLINVDARATVSSYVRSARNFQVATDHEQAMSPKKF